MPQQEGGKQGHTLSAAARYTTPKISRAILIQTGALGKAEQSRCAFSFGGSAYALRLAVGVEKDAREVISPTRAVQNTKSRLTIPIKSTTQPVFVQLYRPVPDESVVIYIGHCRRNLCSFLASRDGGGGRASVARTACAYSGQVCRGMYSTCYPLARITYVKLCVITVEGNSMQTEREKLESCLQAGMYPGPRTKARLAAAMKRRADLLDLASHIVHRGAGLCAT